MVVHLLVIFMFLVKVPYCCTLIKFFSLFILFLRQISLRTLLLFDKFHGMQDKKFKDLFRTIPSPDELYSLGMEGLKADIILVDAEKDKKLSKLKQLIVAVVKGLHSNPALMIKKIAVLVSVLGIVVQKIMTFLLFFCSSFVDNFEIWSYANMLGSILKS